MDTEVRVSTEGSSQNKPTIEEAKPRHSNNSNKGAIHTSENFQAEREKTVSTQGCPGTEVSRAQLSSRVKHSSQSTVSHLLSGTQSDVLEALWSILYHKNSKQTMTSGQRQKAHVHLLCIYLI